MKEKETIDDIVTENNSILFTTEEALFASIIVKDFNKSSYAIRRNIGHSLYVSPRKNKLKLTVSGTSYIVWYASFFLKAFPEAPTLRLIKSLGLRRFLNLVIDFLKDNGADEVFIEP